MKRMTRRLLHAAFVVLCAITTLGAEQPDRPNILWISLEDITPMMGCYGDKYARTPVFDQLAVQVGLEFVELVQLLPVLFTGLGLALGGPGLAGLRSSCRCLGAR